MNKEIQEIHEFESEYRENWCKKIEAFMKNNFPIGSRITEGGEEYEVIGYNITYYNPPYLVCDKIVHQEKQIFLYDLYEMVEKAEGGKQ